MKKVQYHVFACLTSFFGLLFSETPPTKISYKKYKSIPPSAGVVADKRSISLSASYTLWQVLETGIIIANGGRNSPFPATNITPSNPPRSGLKVCGGKHLFYDNWGATIAYTWFYNPATLQSNGFVPITTYTSSWISIDYDNLTNIKSRFYNQFNRIEFKLSRTLQSSSRFIVIPWLGAQGVWEDEDLDADMNIIAEENLFFTMRNRQYWWCVGPYAGTKLVVPLLTHFSLYVNAGTGINLAKHDITLYQEVAPLTDISSTTAIVNNQDHLWSVEPMVEASLGLSASHNFGSVTGFANASWELQTWFAHNGFLPAYQNTGVFGNYSMQGLTATIGVYF